MFQVVGPARYTAHGIAWEFMEFLKQHKDDKMEHESFEDIRFPIMEASFNVIMFNHGGKKFYFVISELGEK